VYFLAQTGQVASFGDQSSGPAMMTFAAAAMVFLAVLVAAASIGLRIVHMTRSTTEPAQVPNFVAVRDDLLYCPKCGRPGPTGSFCQTCGFNFTPILSVPPPLPTGAPPPLPLPYATPVKAKQNPFWPSIHDEKSARQAASQGMWASFFCSGATVLAVFLTHSGMLPFQGITDLALLDAGAFAVLGMGIRNMSRIAAVAAMILYLFERVAMAGKLGPSGTPIVVIIGVVFCFLNALRGTFAFHNFEAGDSPQTSRV
jgi:hypothetical protein